MKRVIRGTLQALRTEYATYTGGVKLSERISKRAATSVTLVEIAELDAQIQLTHSRVKRLGATYMDVLREGYFPEEKQENLVRSVNCLWCPRWPGRIALVAWPTWIHFCLGPIPFGELFWAEAIMLVIVVGVQSFGRTLHFYDCSKKKHALDYLARRHEESAKKEEKD